MEKLTQVVGMGEVVSEGVTEHTQRCEVKSVRMRKELAFGILEIWVTVNPSIADIPISSIEDVSQLTGLEWPRDSTNEDGFAGINRLSMVHDVITVTQPPRPDLHLCVVNSHNTYC